LLITVAWTADDGVEYGSTCQLPAALGVEITGFTVNTGVGSPLPLGGSSSAVPGCMAPLEELEPSGWLTVGSPAEAGAGATPARASAARIVQRLRCRPPFGEAQTEARRRSVARH
jgi:hypothetical protein